MSNETEPVREHSFDGIQEYDNPLPGWWKLLFVASILFSGPYFFFYHSGVEGRSVADDYNAAVSANLRLQFAEIGELKPDRATIAKYMNDANWLKVGESVYKSNCVSCHGAEGQGLVGPNLTDDFYKNVVHLEDIAKVVGEGAAAQAMPAWKNRLHPNELVLVSSYVAKMRGSRTSMAGKEPYGQKIGPWETTTAGEAAPAPSTTPPAKAGG